MFWSELACFLITLLKLCNHILLVLCYCRFYRRCIHCVYVAMDASTKAYINMCWCIAVLYLWLIFSSVIISWMHTLEYKFTHFGMPLFVQFLLFYVSLVLDKAISCALLRATCKNFLFLSPDRKCSLVLLLCYYRFYRRCIHCIYIAMDASTKA